VLLEGLGRLLESWVVKGDVMAVDSTRVHAYSQWSPYNRIGQERPWTQSRRGMGVFNLGYRVRTAVRGGLHSHLGSVMRGHVMKKRRERVSKLSTKQQ